MSNTIVVFAAAVVFLAVVTLFGSFATGRAIKQLQEQVQIHNAQIIELRKEVDFLKQ